MITDADSKRRRLFEEVQGRLPPNLRRFLIDRPAAANFGAVVMLKNTSAPVDLS